MSSRFGETRRRNALVLTGAALLWSVCAWAGPAAVDPPVAISGASPLAPGCGVAAIGEGFADAEVETQVAVDPSEPDRIVAAWVEGGYTGIVSGVSGDGGATWTTVAVPGASVCSGGSHEIVANPWVSIGPEGTAYLSSFAIDVPAPGVPLPVRTRLQVNTSDDGGLSWSPPVEVAGEAVLAHDKPAITADPYTPCAAYLVWSEQPSAFGPPIGTHFSRTLDCGASWSSQIPALYHPGGGTLGAELLVLPGGVLVVVTSVIPPGYAIGLLPAATASHVRPLVPKEPFLIASSRSTDGGTTWSPPVLVAAYDPGQNNPFFFEDPERPGDQIHVAVTSIGADVAPDGSLYVAWPHVDAADDAEIRIARSIDGGQTWGPPSTVASIPGRVFPPTVAVAGNGAIGVTYYDTRGDVPGDGPLAADVRLSHSHDGGASWSEAHLAGPFDLRGAPYRRLPSEGRFLGNYHGLAGLAAGFAATFPLTAPHATIGATDIFFSRPATP